MIKVKQLLVLRQIYCKGNGFVRFLTKNEGEKGVKEGKKHLF